MKVLPIFSSFNLLIHILLNPCIGSLKWKKHLKKMTGYKKTLGEHWMTSFCVRFENFTYQVGHGVLALIYNCVWHMCFWFLFAEAELDSLLRGELNVVRVLPMRQHRHSQVVITAPLTTHSTSGPLSSSPSVGNFLDF